MNDLNTDLIAEARRRVPTLSDAQWAAWVSFVELHGGAVVLPIGDGTPYAVYPDQDAPTRQPEAFTGHANHTRPSAAKETPK